MAELVHGVHSTYNNHKCRCLLCSQANTDYWKRTRHEKKSKGECRNCNEPVCKKSKTFCEFHRLMHNEQSARHNRGKNAKKETVGNTPTTEAGSGRQIQDVTSPDPRDKTSGGEISVAVRRK